MKKSEEKEYQVYHQMKQRCYNQKSKKYPNYGARGIFICDRWMEKKGMGYENFIEDMGRRPSDKHSIERVHVDGPYSPDNCVWLLISEQNWNRTDNAVVLVSDVFGMLTVIREVEPRARRTEPNSVRRYFLVRCECGKEKEIRMDKLRQRRNQSCGNRTCNKYAPID